MSSVLQSSNREIVTSSTSDLFLRHRLKVVEDLWESVLRQECGQELVDLLNQLRDLGSPEGQAAQFKESEVRLIVEKLDLNAAIRASRAFALYFQLINIIEQRYEQRHQHQAQTNINSANFNFSSDNTYPELSSPGEVAQPVVPGADMLEKTLQSKPASKRQMGTFQWLFPHLRHLNVPPQQIERLIKNLDVRLVFTAHPTEIVRHTIRDKQRRIAKILQQLDQVEEELQSVGLVSSWESIALVEQLTEEIRLWWRTDELHQFKPTVLDEVDYTLHYFQEVLFDAVPKLYQRLKVSLYNSFPYLSPPRYNFCKFGSWVGSDRDGNPSVTPQVTWQTACYQRNLVLEKYCQSVRSLIELLSLSLHWSDVLPELLDSLEQDRVKMPEIYEKLAIRYRQEPYRLKLAYILKRLENTRDRNWRFYTGEVQQRELTETEPVSIYQTGIEFLTELELIKRTLTETGLSCSDLENLICQVQIYGFNLAHLDIRQESSHHSDAFNEITEYLQILPRSYSNLNESERVEWLVQELQTRTSFNSG